MFLKQFEDSISTAVAFLSQAISETELQGRLTIVSVREAVPETEELFSMDTEYKPSKKIQNIVPRQKMTRKVKNKVRTLQTCSMVHVA